MVHRIFFAAARLAGTLDAPPPHSTTPLNYTLTGLREIDYPRERSSLLFFIYLPFSSAFDFHIIPTI